MFGIFQKGSLELKVSEKKLYQNEKTLFIKNIL